MFNKKMICSTIFSLLFLFVFTTTAEAVYIGCGTRIGHSSWSSDFGAKTFWYRPDYSGEKYSGTVDAVKDHDFFAYKLQIDNIFPPDIGNGEVTLTNVQMLNSSDSVISTMTGFSSGTIRGIMLPGDAMLLYTRKNYSSIYAADTGDNKIRSNFIFTIDDSFTIPTNTWSDQMTTGTF